MIYQNLNLSYYIYSEVHRHNQKRIHCVLSTLNYLIAKKKCFKKLINNFISSVADHDFYIVAFGMHPLFISNIFWWHKVNFHCQMNFDSSDVSGLSITLLKYGLIFLEYCSIDRILLPSLLCNPKFIK